jgi:hypothetical protein
MTAPTIAVHDTDNFIDYTTKYVPVGGCKVTEYRCVCVRVHCREKAFITGGVVTF